MEEYLCYFKYCKKCKQVKHVSEMSWAGSILTSCCKDCATKASNDYYNSLSYNEKLSARYYARYGLTLKQLEEIYHRQKGKCGICRRPIKLNWDERPNFHVDHDHNTGEVRGILCSRCNIALGHLEKWFMKYYLNILKYIGDYIFTNM